MKRREFIVLAGGAAVTSPLPLSAQQARAPTIGILLQHPESREPFLSDLRVGLRALGYVEDRNIRWEVRTAEGKADLLAEKAAELVRLKVDIIVAFQTPAAVAARQATKEIPIVMVRVGDPIATGLIASFPRPGGNVTGTSAGLGETAAKVVELIPQSILPARRIAFVNFNAADPFAQVLEAAVGVAAASLGLEMIAIVVRPSESLEQVFVTMAGKQVDAFMVSNASGVTAAVVELASKYRLPLFAFDRRVPVAGGLMSYAAKFDALHRETAVYIDKILKGSKPADLPVSFPTRFELVINLKTAESLGVPIPAVLLARADELIE